MAESLPTTLGYSVAVNNVEGELSGVGGPEGETFFASADEGREVLSNLDITVRGKAAVHVVALVPVFTITADDSAVPAD